MVSGEHFDWNDDNLVDGKTYFEARPTMIQIPPESVAELKAFFLKYCKQYKKCSKVEKIFYGIENF